MTKLHSLVPLLALLGCYECRAFAPSTSTPLRTRRNEIPAIRISNNPKPSAQTVVAAAGRTGASRLYNGIIIDVDDNFFTVAFFSVGLFYSLGKAYNRYLLEEVAFEQRKMENRERKLEEDPSLNELDLRRVESAAWLSVYGRKFRGEGETLERDGDGGRRGRVRVVDREGDLEEDDEYGMSDGEINDFESSFGVEYDPYYDEPYEESELPVGKYKADKSYGDRRYANGEVFYKDEGTGMFYRQGSRPRQKKFWDLNSS